MMEWNETFWVCLWTTWDCTESGSVGLTYVYQWWDTGWASTGRIPQLYIPPEDYDKETQFRHICLSWWQTFFPVKSSMPLWTMIWKASTWEELPYIAPSRGLCTSLRSTNKCRKFERILQLEYPRRAQSGGRKWTTNPRGWKPGQIPRTSIYLGKVEKICIGIPKGPHNGKTTRVKRATTEWSWRWIVNQRGGHIHFELRNDHIPTTENMVCKY